MIIVTLTTYKGRIKNIPLVLQSILNNTIVPDKICLNVSVEDFPNKENDFTENVKRFLKVNNDIIEIHWLKHDTKVWKKSVPTLYRYPNDPIICIDDDILYPEFFMKQMLYVNGEYPTSGGDFQVVEQNVIQHYGRASLDLLSFLQNELERMNEEIFSLGDEDTFFTYCYYRNNVVPLLNKSYLYVQEYNRTESYTERYKIDPKRTWQACKNNDTIYDPSVKNRFIEYICEEA